METFALHPGRWPIMRLLGRNPLIRLSDRIEAAMLALMVAVSLAALPAAAAVGTAVHDSHGKAYAEQARTRESVAAVALGDSVETVRPFSVMFTVEARWPTGHGDRRGLLSWDRAVKAGERLNVWVDNAGNPVTPPAPAARAGVDAVAAAVAIWLWATAAAAGLFGLVRLLLDRYRSAAWDDEIGHLADDGGGRRSDQP